MPHPTLELAVRIARHDSPSAILLQIASRLHPDRLQIASRLHPNAKVLIAGILLPLTPAYSPLDCRPVQSPPLPPPISRRLPPNTPYPRTPTPHPPPYPQLPHSAVRVRLVEELRTILEPQLGEGALVVSGSSMERREGSEYDFNEPLLERLVGAAPPFDTGDVVVAMAFCLPGRHAGPGGDVAEILEAARVGEPGLRTFTTPLLAAQPLVLELLRDRALAAEQEVLQSEASVPAPHALM